jgi:hypothetical protein
MIETSIIVPVYNEAKTLENCIKKISKAVQKITNNFEIIIAEDGSTDGTYEIAKGLSKKNTRIKVLHSKERLGKGKALKNAFRNARGEIVVYMDADLSSDLNYLKPLIDRIKDGASIATGSRLIKGAVSERSLKRDMASKVFNFLVRFLLDSKVYDHQCGMKAFDRKTILPFLEKIKDNYWFWDTELLVKAQREGFRVDEIPIKWSQGKFTKVSFTNDAIYMAKKIIGLRRELNKQF